MFGFSIGKLLILLALIVVSWGLFSSRRRMFWRSGKDDTLSREKENNETAATLQWCEKCQSYHVSGDCANRGSDGA